MDFNQLCELKKQYVKLSNNIEFSLKTFLYYCSQKIFTLHNTLK